ncbi:SIR2 family protein [Enterobacter mori]|uniref:SIR2 family protein n=1 Tax=Enterobacter asburiae TaxID=61645 RepID=UPI001880ACC8|nr:SIR2 family protein [Enterobacter asburiae]MBE8906599.1 SIR2 family protein [Enterobacter asburiae]
MKKNNEPNKNEKTAPDAGETMKPPAGSIAEAMALAAGAASSSTSIITELLNSKFLGGFSSSAIKNLEIKIKGITQPAASTILKNLRNNFKDENLVLVLGAGISLDNKIPTWNELLKRLLARALEDTNENQKMVSALFNEVFGPNALIAARYLKLHFDGVNTPLEKEIQRVLYEYYDETESGNLKAIKKLCISAGKSPGLDSVITYNYDDILEQTLTKADVGIKFKVISKTGQHARNDELPIYHVHGYLPMHGKVELDDSLVLSDESYHRQYVDLYHWSNMVQLNKFKDSNCLFIGHSFTDPNLRRLLDTAKKLRGDGSKPHYLIKCRHSKEEVIGNINKILRNSSAEFAKELENDIDKIAASLLETVHTFEEIDANSFGVNVIWIKDYKEIAPLLNDLTQ